MIGETLRSGVSSPDITVVSTVDAGFLPYVGVVATSMAHFAKSGADIRYLVFYDGPESADSAALDGCRLGPVEIRLRKAPTSLRRFGTRFDFNPTTLLRLQLAEELQELDRICYLDTDMLVRTDIEAMFQTDLGGALLAAAPDCLLAPRAYRGAMVPAASVGMTMGDYLEQVIGLPPPKWGQYVNSAAMVMDLRALRQDNFHSRAIDLLEAQNDRLMWRDQDVINILARGAMKLLDASWNVAAGALRHAEISGLPEELGKAMRAQQREQKILHYAGSLKPWNRTTWLPRSGEWWHFARLSPTWPTIEQRYRRTLKERGAMRNPLVSVATAAARLKYSAGKL